MQEIKIRLKKTDSMALFHDSRGDAIVMAKALNIAIEKINELVAEVNQLKELAGRSNGVANNQFDLTQAKPSQVN